MAFAIASLVCAAPIQILDTGPVATSFPGFVETAAGVGLTIEVQDD
jgi:5-enolpyruvylshikimate-3-phosphate synthase